MTPRLILCLTTLLCLTSARADDALKSELERVYNAWRAALMAKSVTAWQRSTAAYRQVYTHNVVVSQGRPYPEALFDLPLTPPTLLDLKLMEAEAVGETAHLIYFGKIDLGIEGEVVPENLMMLKFYKEGDQWMFDTTKYFNLGSDPEMRNALQSGKPDFLDSPAFSPPGKAPAVPKLCKKPEKIGAIRIHAIGYEVRANLNGFDHDPVADDATQQLAIGGLARGPNKLVLNIQQIPLSDEAGAERHLEVQVVMATDNPERPTTRVFRWEPKTHPAPAKVDLNVVLDIQTMKGI